MPPERHDTLPPARPRVSGSNGSLRLSVSRYRCATTGRVGKTSIVLRFVRNEYDDRQVSTQEAAYLDKNITLGTQVRVRGAWQPPL